MTPDDLRYIEDVATKLYEFARSHPELGIKKLDTHSTPVIGPRLIGTSADGRSQAVLTIVAIRTAPTSRRRRASRSTASSSGSRRTARPRRRASNWR